MRVSVIVYSFILLAVFKNTSGEKGHEKIERKVFFGDLRDGKRFRGERLLSKSVASGTMCAMKCIRNPKCRSFNFCNSGMVCELNRHDLFSTQYGAKMLDSAPNCLYAGMRKSYIPECYYNGMKSDISNDQDPNNCEIIHKRVDFEWSVWGELTVENSDTLLKKYYTREKLIEAAHGGKTGSTLEGSVKVIYWLNFVHELKTWQNAKRRCTDMDGKLFFKVSQVRIIEELVKILNWKLINQLVFSPLKKTSFVFKTFSIKFYRSLPCTTSTALMALFGTPCIMIDMVQNTSG